MSLTAFKVFITVTYNGPDAPAAHKTIRRFSAKPGTTLAEFRTILIEDILRRPEGSVAIAVSYKDADGDVVEVASELEWAEALQQHSGAVASGAAIPILIDVSMGVPSHLTISEHLLRFTPFEVSTPGAEASDYNIPTQQPPVAQPQPRDDMSQFSPIEQSDDSSDSNLFGHTIEPSSESCRPVPDSEMPLPIAQPSQPADEPEREPLLAARTSTTNEDQRQPQEDEDALALPQPSTDALLLEDEASPSTPVMDGHNGWEEVNADEVGEVASISADDEEGIVEGEASASVSAASPVEEEGSFTEEEGVDATPESHGQYTQAQSQANQPQAHQQVPRRDLGFFAAPLAWLNLAHQQLAAHPRATNRYPRWQGPQGNASPATGNNINNGVGFAATVARYQKRTGATKAEDTVRLLALCPNATAQQAQEALDKFNGQVYRAANYLLDITSPTGPQQ